MSKKKQVCISIDEELQEKLDIYAKETRRTRSQAVETLIVGHSMDKVNIMSAQAQKIKELESELILLRSDTGELPKIDKELLADQIAENERLNSLLKEAKKKEELCLRLQSKLINLGDSINGLYKESQREVL